MILNKLVAFIYHLIGVRVDERIREATSRTGYVVMKADMLRNVKEEGAASKLKLEEARLRGGESSSEGEICCVCLSGMEEEDETRVLPCLHHFHKGCVDRWVSSCRKNCPVCRFSVGEEERFDYHTREAFTEDMVTWFSSFHVAGF